MHVNDAHEVIYVLGIAHFAFDFHKFVCKLSHPLSTEEAFWQYKQVNELVRLVLALKEQAHLQVHY